MIYDPIFNDTFADMGKYDNETRWYSQNKDSMPIWLLNQERSNRKSAVVGGYPGANTPILNRTIGYSFDYGNQLEWTKKIDILIDLFLYAQVNFGVLYFADPGKLS